MLDPQDAKKYLDILKQYRLNFEPDWYRNHFAYENNTFISWSRSAQTIVRMPYRKTFFMNLPETKKQADSFENMLLQFMPLFVPYPTDISNKKSLDDARYLGKFLEQKYMEWDSSNIIHNFVHNAIKYPVSFFEISIENKLDPITQKVKKCIVPRIGDVFDWYFDPRIPFEDNQVIIKVLRKSLFELKQFGGFKEPKNGTISPIQDMKEMIYANKYGNRDETGDLKTILAYQVFEKTKKGIDVQIIDEDANVLDKRSYAGASFWPVVPLTLYSGDVYQPSFVQNMIPINRSISLIANRIEQFIMKFTKGSYLVRDGSDISFSDENAIVVKYEGEAPTVMPVPIMQPAILQWFQNLFSLAERYGMNQAALAVTAKSSNQRTAEQQRMDIASQQTQQKTPLDNLIQAFKQIAERTIYYYSEYTDEPIDMTIRTEGDEYDVKQFIGEKYKAKAPDAITIPHTVKTMKVEIQDISSASIQAKRDEIFKLAQEFMNIPAPFQKVLLNLYKVGPTSDIVEDLEKSQTLLDNPEFQALIEQARAGNMDAQTKQALAVVLKFLASQSPVPPMERMGVQSNVKPKEGQNGKM